jgi:hypothetical protein
MVFPIVVSHNALESFAGHIAGKIFHDNHIMHPLKFGGYTGIRIGPLPQISPTAPAGHSFPLSLIWNITTPIFV